MSSILLIIGILAIFDGVQSFGMGHASAATRSLHMEIKLEEVKNMRDMCEAYDQIAPNKLIRTGCLSKSSEADIGIIREQIGFKALVDLRSPAEIAEDELIASKVYDGFSSYQYSKKAKVFEIKDEKDLINTDGSRRRYFISLMSESLIKKGVFFRFRKRIRFKAVGLYLLSLLSRRAEKKVRGIFIDTINGGGLSLLNELVVDSSGPEIIEVLKLSTEPSNHPIALYCTAGKDRTGLISMLLLHVLGATDEQIITDYVLSDSAYREIGDKRAMVAALKQTDVDPDTFLRAKPEVMVATMAYVRDTFGSIDGFLDAFGYDETWRTRLRKNVLL